MTDLYNGQITDLLQQNEAARNPEAQALAYAILAEKRRIIDLAQRTRTISMVDLLPEEILDVLAVELRTPYYTGDMDVEQKRTLVKNTLEWFHKAGTPAAVRELIAAVFSQGDIVEWFNYTDPPYTPGTFDIVTDAPLTADAVARFMEIIRLVKNTRSHLRRVLIGREATGKIYAGAAMHLRPTIRVTNTVVKTVTAMGGPYIGTGIVLSTKYTITETEE